MSERGTLVRKIAYLLCIVVLWFPLYWLSQPATTESAGGKLAQLRAEYKIGQAELGEIDPTSETLKLATLGFRPLAVAILWHKVNKYKTEEDWTNFETTLRQIISLQPNFYSIWDYQAHNLSYNTSVEFDNYRDRYYWVMEGINFLKKGREINQSDPRLVARIGWYIAQKIGRDDAHRQYRRLFKDDDDFHNADRPGRGRGERDNWLVGKEYFLAAQKLVDGGQPLRVYLNRAILEEKAGRKTEQSGIMLGTSPVVFHSEPMMTSINYADALETDSTMGESAMFGDEARRAWRTAASELDRFAHRSLPLPTGGTVRLHDLEAIRERAAERARQIEQLAPGLKASIEAEKRAALSDAERAALDVTTDKRTSAQWTQAQLAEAKIETTWLEVAERVEPDRRAEARNLAREEARSRVTATHIDSLRQIANFEYWRARCEAEPTDAALQARELIYQAKSAFDDARATEARELYERAWQQWRIVLDAAPVLRKDTLMAEDLVVEIERYRSVLRFLGVEQEFPKPFLLQDVLDLYAESNAPPPEDASPE